LYELKQYELFSNNHYDNHPYDSHQHQQHVRSYSNGTNYSQNILNYNNSYYKINNINNYNYIKSKSPTTYRSTDDVDVDHRKWSTSYYHRGTSEKMEHTDDIMAVERSHLVKEHEANGQNVTIHNFNAGNGHSTVHVPSNTMRDDEEHVHRHSGNPFQPKQHFTQVSFNFFNGNLLNTLSLFLLSFLFSLKKMSTLFFTCVECNLIYFASIHFLLSHNN
jgi:hypothetical protein